MTVRADDERKDARDDGDRDTDRPEPVPLPHGDLEGEALFALARHYQLGVPATDPARMIEISRRAARAAQELHASGETYLFLAAAGAAAEAAGLDLDAEFEEQIARACLFDGRSLEAEEHYERALKLTSDPWTRARSRVQLSQIDFAEGRFDHGADNVDTALRELRHPVARREPRDARVG